MKIKELSIFDEFCSTSGYRIKVCCTCVAWSPAYKGTCLIDKKGVGKFWFCERWEEAKKE